jgi:hypothetical protein
LTGYGKVEVIMVGFVICLIVVLFSSSSRVNANELPSVGYHLLDPGELELAVANRGEIEGDMPVVVPMSVYDRRKEVWERFFRTANEADVVPIVRWITRFEDGNWKIPSRKDIVEAVRFMNQIQWQGRRIIVLFNEPNHAAEWGGKVDPEGYAEVALFATNWLKTEREDYVVLPAGLDNDAPSEGTTMDSFVFIEQMYRSTPEMFMAIDGWTSHSYPNPAFSGSAFATGKNSIRGFEHELSLLKRLTDRDFSIYITETGWRQNNLTSRRLIAYYKEAMNKVWINQNVEAVVVFVLKAAHGPFEEFSLLTEDDQPTLQMRALQLALDGK